MLIPIKDWQQTMEETMAARLINHIKRTSAVFTTTTKVDRLYSQPPRIQDDMEAENNEHQFNSYLQKWKP